MVSCITKTNDERKNDEDVVLSAQPRQSQISEWSEFYVSVGGQQLSVANILTQPQPRTTQMYSNKRQHKNQTNDKRTK